MQRFDEFYKVRQKANLGDPEFWNVRFQDLDLRLAARELDGGKIDGAVDTMISVALARLNDTFTPVVSEAIDRLASVGALFSSTSATETDIGTGNKTFLLDAATRSGFVVPEYVALRPASHTDRGMIAQVINYDRATGLLDVTVVLFTGSGVYDDWVVRLTGAPDVDHSTRTDNPHETTAEQVGAYTKAAVDFLLDALVIADIGGLVNALAAKAPLSGPTFTNAPKGPTAPTVTNDTQLATTAFVKAAIAAGQPIETGTLMVFQQTNAPTGWTKQTAHNDKALRVVNGAAGSGGVLPFSSTFARTSTDAFTLSTSEMPYHAHQNNQNFRTGAVSGNANYPEAGDSTAGTYASAGTTVANGSGGAHGHGIDIRVQYVDIIIARKD
jgi:hypothetical protein